MARRALARGVTFDDKCYYLDGRPQWFQAGAAHYFRIPPELWAERILAVKRAGLNTIQTYVPWNFHEPVKGKFDFRGERDLNAFLQLCHRMGMFVIARPGPYICAEWDFGGLPPYLVAEPNIRYRVNNSAYVKAVDHWLAKVLPILARNQVTRSGSVVLVQNENEYMVSGVPGGREYLLHVNRVMRKAGIVVPIVVCNFLAERIPDTIETLNAWDDLTWGIRQLRQAQPDTPKTVTEFWSGWFHYWGGPSSGKSARELHRRVLEMLSVRAMFSYYMFAGGTNFGFWSGRTNVNDQAFITTSYDFEAPVSEAGGLTAKYYESRLGNLLGANFAGFFTSAQITRSRASVSAGFECRSLRTERGEMIFVLRQRENSPAAAELSFRTRQSMRLDLSESDAEAFLYRFELLPGLTVDGANLPCLGMLPGDTPWVFFFGRAGQSFSVSVNGTTVSGTVPSELHPRVVELPGVRLVILPRDLARRTWFLEDSVVIGPKFVGEAGDDDRPTVVPARGERTYWTVTSAQGLKTCPAPEKPLAPTLPLLQGWRSWSVLPELCANGGGWKEIAHNGTFKTPESVGYTRGYMLYRTTVHARKSGDASFLFTQAGDRLNIFVNGEFVTTWGRGEGAQTGLVTAPLVEGENRLRVLVDNLGRCNFGYSHFGEHKGITGEIFVGARELRLSNVSWIAKDIARRQHLSTWEMANWLGKGALMARLPEIQKRLKNGVPNQPATTLSATFRLEEAQGALLTLRDVRLMALVFVNGELVGRHYGPVDAGYAEMRLDEFVHAGLNDLLIQFVGLTEPAPGDMSIRLFGFRKGNRLTTSWQMKPFLPALEPPLEIKAHRVAQRMTCYRVPFKMDPPAQPVFVELAGLGKGQLFLNGHNVGRYWHIQPPHRYYLPQPWFRDSETLNELVLFEELEGFRPQDVRLLYCTGPFSEELY